MWSYKRFWQCVQQLVRLLSVISNTVFPHQIQLDRWDGEIGNMKLISNLRGLGAFFESHIFSVRKGGSSSCSNSCLFWMIEKRKSLCTLPMSLLAPKVALRRPITIRLSIPSQSHPHIALKATSHELRWTKMNKYELRVILKDKSGQKAENTERQKDNTHDSEGFHPNFNELRWTNMNY